jgi:hypothetical protein
MAYDYVALSDNVARPLIENYGTPITVIRTEDISNYVKKYDPVLGSYYWIHTPSQTRYDEQPEATKQEFSGYAVITRYKNDEIDGTNVQRDDRRLLCIGIPEPKVTDIFQIDNEQFYHIFTEPVAPGNAAVVYKIQVRK